MASVASTERYRFGSFELEPEKRRLLKDGATISLRPRAFDLLAALVDRARHLVTKRALYRRDVESAKALLGDDAFEQAFREGRAMSLDDAVRYALSDQDAVDNATERPQSATS
jgi:DNA-binding response OmpR family regulator